MKLRCCGLLVLAIALGPPALAEGIEHLDPEAGATVMAETTHPPAADGGASSLRPIRGAPRMAMDPTLPVEYVAMDNLDVILRNGGRDFFCRLGFGPLMVVAEDCVPLLSRPEALLLVRGALLEEFLIRGCALDFGADPELESRIAAGVEARIAALHGGDVALPQGPEPIVAALLDEVIATLADSPAWTYDETAQTVAWIEDCE